MSSSEVKVFKCMPFPSKSRILTQQPPIIMKLGMNQLKASYAKKNSTMDVGLIKRIVVILLKIEEKSAIVGSLVGWPGLDEAVAFVIGARLQPLVLRQ